MQVSRAQDEDEIIVKEELIDFEQPDHMNYEEDMKYEGCKHREMAEEVLPNPSSLQGVSKLSSMYLTIVMLHAMWWKWLAGGTVVDFERISHNCEAVICLDAQL